MHTLSIETFTPEGAPNLPPAPKITALLTLTGNRETYLCNPMEEIKDAVGSGEMFVAHEVRGLVAHELVVNPRHVVTIATRS